MRKLLFLLSTFSFSAISIMNTTACSNSTSDINKYKWDAKFSQDNSIWIEASNSLNLQATGKFKFKNYDFSAVLPLYQAYAQEWFANNNLTATTDVVQDASANQTTIAGSTITTNTDTVFLMGYIDNSRNQKAVENSIKNKSWDSIFDSTEHTAKYKKLNYFYLQAPNGSDTNSYTADSDGYIQVKLTVYFLVGSKSTENKVNVDKVESGTITFNFKVQ